MDIRGPNKTLHDPPVVSAERHSLYMTLPSCTGTDMSALAFLAVSFMTNFRASMDIHGLCMDNPWNIHGYPKIMHGQSMDIHGLPKDNPWMSMDYQLRILHGYTWTIDGYPWEPIGNKMWFLRFSVDITCHFRSAFLVFFNLLVD